MTILLLQNTQKKPMVDKIRPKSLREVFGQEYLLKNNAEIQKNNNKHSQYKKEQIT